MSPMDEAQRADLQFGPDSIGLFEFGSHNCSPSSRLFGELGCRKGSLSFQNVLGVWNAADMLFQYCRARKDVIDNDCGFPPMHFEIFSPFHFARDLIIVQHSWSSNLRTSIVTLLLFFLLATFSFPSVSSLSSILSFIFIFQSLALLCLVTFHSGPPMVNHLKALLSEDRVVSFHHHFSIPNDVQLSLVRDGEVDMERTDENTIVFPLLAIAEGGVHFPFHPTLRFVLSH